MKYKNKLLPILCFALCLCIVWGSTATAYASDVVEENITCKAQFEVGDTFILRCDTEYSNNGHKTSAIITGTVTDSNKYMCFYLKDDSAGVSTSGKVLGGHYDVPNATVEHTFSNANWNYPSDGLTPVSDYCFPILYHKPDTSWVADKLFYTNIPIFETQEDALAYRSGELMINDAINYNKNLENGSWVSPFEDIEINDNDMPVPSLSNLSHNGFNISNRDENYAVDVYVVNGMRKPGEFVNGVTLNLSSYLYGNTLGWLTDTEEAYMQDSFDLVKDFGVDNESLLNESVKAFYTDYPNAKAFYPDANFLTKVYYPVWGEPFGINNFVYNDVTEVTAADLAKVDCYDIPLCFTQYKVRFYYYDENDGMHFGPWAVVTYCSNGDVKSSISYSNSDGSVIDTPIENGKQDDYGNISFDNNDVSEFIDLSDPNALFGNIRSIFNNIKATTGSYSVIFTTVFSFIPADIQGLIWLGIAVIVFIGVVKAF